ncbi:class C sortase [Enterococcus aquimarinus]|uniref:class C sortase n=1 Tax=Enterococcus aquimarinus TaxID=328396 RepID=UPI000900092B|nr:class C sortase [Enterococcus aquimarinus]
MKKRKNNHPFISKIVMIVLFLVGSLTMFYPFYINALNQYLDQVRMERYQKKSEEQYASQQAQLAEANRKLAETGIHFTTDPFEDTAGGRLSKEQYDKHVIGQVNIPKLAIEIPLFDTTTPNLLEVGATVINGTSFPVGGAGTHSVISAHRGLPERELFTNLPKLNNGDLFLLEVLGETLAYEVISSEVVEPNETSSLKIIDDQDLVTLVTCTPYMINSHRLLVTGKRVPYTPEIKQAIQNGDRFRRFKQFAILTGVSMIVVLSLWLLVRVIRQEALRRTRFDLAIQLNSDPADTQKAIQLYNRQGKKPLIRDHQPFIRTTDASGKAIFENLPGGLYQIAIEGEKQKIKVGIKKKGQATKIYSKKQRNQKPSPVSVLMGT